MVNLSHFVHAWLVFVTPLKFLHYKVTTRQKVIFTIIYGIGIILARYIYNCLLVPFGTHTVILLISHTILLKVILKDFSWQNAMYTSLITFIVLLINDSIILLPVMKLSGITINDIEQNGKLAFWTIAVLSNVLLIVIYIALGVRDLLYKKKGFKQHHS